MNFRRTLFWSRHPHVWLNFHDWHDVTRKQSLKKKFLHNSHFQISRFLSKHLHFRASRVYFRFHAKEFVAFIAWASLECALSTPPSMRRSRFITKCLRFEEFFLRTLSDAEGDFKLLIGSWNHPNEMKREKARKKDRRGENCTRDEKRKGKSFQSRASCHYRRRFFTAKTKD